MGRNRRGRKGGRRTLVTSASAVGSTPKSEWNTNGIEKRGRQRERERERERYTH